MRDLLPTFVDDKFLQLLDALFFVFNNLLGFSVNTIEGVQLFLKLDYPFISLI